MSDETPVTPPAPPAESPPEVVGDSDGTSKLLAVLGYLFWPVALVALLIDPYKAQFYSRANAVQALAIGVASWVAWMVPVVGWIVAIVLFVFAIIAILKALKGEVYEVPVLYGLVKSFIDG
jgi:uncharacterized membrane protein